MHERIRKMWCVCVYIQLLFRKTLCLRTLTIIIANFIIVCMYIHTYTHTHTYTYHGILCSHKKKEILPFAATWMDLEGIMLSEVSQTEKDKYHVISLICGI